MSEHQHQTQQSHDLTRSSDVVASPAAREAPFKTAPLGNQAMQRLLRARAIQAKLNVGQPDDAYEKEADRMADTIMRMPAPTSDSKPKRDDDRKKTVQRKTEPKKEDEKKPVQRKEENKKKDDEKKPVQRKAEEKKKEDKEETIQSKSEGSQTPEVTPQIESSIQTSRSSGHPLSDTSRSFYEPRLGRDLSQVRLHTDSTAAGAARDLNAQAFTQGQDIFFGAGRYQPHTSEGQRLLGHELTHTIQQSEGDLARLPEDHTQAGPVVSGGVQRNAIQRTNGQQPPGGPPPPTTPGPAPAGPNLLTLGPLVPPSHRAAGFAANPTRIYRPPGYSSRSLRERARATDAVGMWAREMGPRLEGYLNSQFAGGSGSYLVRPRGEGGQRYIGSVTTLAQVLATPTWRRGAGGVPLQSTGPLFTYDVDHIVPLQVGWEPTRPVTGPLTERDFQAWAHTPTNFQLVADAANRREPRQAWSIEQQISALARAAAPQQGLTEARLLDEVPIRFTVGSAGGNGFSGVGDNSIWSQNEIETGAHLQFGQIPKNRHFLSVHDLGNPSNNAGVFSPLPSDFRWAGDDQPDGTRNRRIYPSVFERGGTTTYFQPRTPDPYDQVFAGAGAAFGPYNPPLRIIAIRNWRFAAGPGTEPLATADITFLDSQVARYFSPQAAPRGFTASLPVRRLRSSNDGTGTITNEDILAAATEIFPRQLPRLSPLEWTQVAMGPKGPTATGIIRTDLPLLRGVEIPIILSPSEVSIEKTFNSGEIQVPSPFAITNSSLTISLGTASGLRITGRIEFEIQRVGRGFLEAVAGTTEGFVLAGGFDFDSTTFNPARIRLRYADGEFSGTGEIGIPSGKVRGIRSATIIASYARQRLEAHGTAEFTIPGVRQGTLDLTYSEAEGMTLAGALELGTVPGIRSGSLSAQVRKPADSDQWLLSARGTAVPNIPGVDSTLTVSYDNGLFTAEARAAYSRGMLSGTIEVGATNRPLDAQGQPIPGGEPTADLTLYGSGQLTIRITPWLQGTAAVRLLPNGEIEVTGSIGLPSSLDIFSEKRLDRNIFSIGLDIPIIGVAVAGQRIGIFATIRGGLDASAGIGPGQLRELGLTITYNPAHEEQTHVTGRAQLYIPARAGLRLFVSGGLGAGIPIVSASLNLEIGASLGLEGAVQASVEVDWTPTRGLVLDALGEIYVQPKFRFDITGRALVEADLLLTTIELYSHRWNLASFEYGSDLRFGVRFPVHYEEGRPFDISLSDVEFEVPQIDPLETLSGLIDRIA